MKRYIFAFSLFGAFLASACVTESTDSDDPTGGTATTPVSECEVSPYQFGDHVLYVCASPLTITHADGQNLVQVGSFTFVNYRKLWNSITRLCVTNVGEDLLDDRIESIFFDVINWDHAPVEVKGPWPNNGQVCLNVPIVIGAKGQRMVSVSLKPVWPYEETGNYRFQITAATDITVNDPEEIQGIFPVTCQTVTIGK